MSSYARGSPTHDPIVTIINRYNIIYRSVCYYQMGAQYYKVPSPPFSGHIYIRIWWHNRAHARNTLCYILQYVKNDRLHRPLWDWVWYCAPTAILRMTPLAGGSIRMTQQPKDWGGSLAVRNGTRPHSSGTITHEFAQSESIQSLLA